MFAPVLVVVGVVSRVLELVYVFMFRGLSTFRVAVVPLVG